MNAFRTFGYFAFEVFGEYLMMFPFEVKKKKFQVHIKEGLIFWQLRSTPDLIQGRSERKPYL